MSKNMSSTKRASRRFECRRSRLTFYDSRALAFVSLFLAERAGITLDDERIE